MKCPKCDSTDTFVADNYEDLPAVIECRVCGNKEERNTYKLVSKTNEIKLDYKPRLTFRQKISVLLNDMTFTISSDIFSDGSIRKIFKKEKEEKLNPCPKCGKTLHVISEGDRYMVECECGYYNEE